MTPRELLLDAALRALVAAEDAIESLPAPSHLALGFDELQDALEDALAAARAALDATDVRGALARAADLDRPPRRPTVWHPWEKKSLKERKDWMAWEARILAALAAKGVE